jgi:hypothetical protein
MMLWKYITLMMIIMPIFLSMFIARYIRGGSEGYLVLF